MGGLGECITRMEVLVTGMPLQAALDGHNRSISAAYTAGRVGVARNPRPEESVETAPEGLKASTAGAYDKDVDMVLW